MSTSIPAPQRESTSPGRHPGGPPDEDVCPPGPLTTAELAAVVPDRRARERYTRLWHGVYRRDDQVDDLRLRSLALARIRPEGVLRGRSAALLWGDDSAPADALPEIWLPATRHSRQGRIYRYGMMPAAAITELGGLRLTTPLRTCRDLACDLEVEDAAVAVDRVCAAVPGLTELLRAAISHPSGWGARRFADVVGQLGPGAATVESTRARLRLSTAGFGGFTEGHAVRIDGRALRLPLADPVSRCVVVTPGGRTGPLTGPEADRLRGALRRAGWTVLVVGDTTVSDTGISGAVALARTGEPGDDARTGALEALRSRWPETQMFPPLDGESVADPLGMWTDRHS